MKSTNYLKLEMPCFSGNEGVARNIAAVFLTRMDPTVEELTEIKTAVSEAISNAVIHAYDEGKEGVINMSIESFDSGKIVIIIEDHGRGIDDVKKAMEPLYTTGDVSERSGMGFTVMESFMDKVAVDSYPGKGTKVTLMKLLDSSNGL